MPLFMDYQLPPDITLEESKKTYLRDLSVQDRYDENYHQLWVNEKDDMVFCLTESPAAAFNKKSLIRDLRMSKALSLIEERKKNITEIAPDVGINNPSYFAKCFHNKYRILPSQVAV